MGDAGSSAVWQRRARLTVRKARLEGAIKQKEAADKLGWSESKLLRVENGTVAINGADYGALLDLYQLGRDATYRALADPTASPRVSAWAKYRGVLAPDFVRYLEFEEAASAILSFTPLMIPGLLQTEEYARTTIRALSGNAESGSVIDKRVEARIRRQQRVLAGDRPTAAHFIIDEGALRRMVGKDVMIRQLEHLATFADHPHVTVQVLPFSVGEHRAMMGPFVILEFPEDIDDALLYVEDPRGELLTAELPEDVAPYRHTFSQLEDLATPKRRLDRTIETLVSQARRPLL